MKKTILLTALLCASTLLFVGCAQKLGIVSTPAGAETVSRLDFSGASGVFIAQENDVSAMSSMGAMSTVGTRKAAKKPSKLYKVTKKTQKKEKKKDHKKPGEEVQAPDETVETPTEPEVEEVVVIEPVVAYNQYDQPVDISGLEILDQKSISTYYFLAQVRNLTDGSVFYWLVHAKSGKVYQFGEDIDDSIQVALMFQKESAANEFYKYYYLNTEGRVICMELNPDSVAKATLATIQGFDYKKAKIDQDDNVILADKFIKSAGIENGTGGYEYIDFDGKAASIFVNKQGEFNYLTSEGVYKVFVNSETKKVESSLLYSVDAANDANEYIPQAHFSLPVLDDGAGFEYYLESKLSDYTNVDGASKGTLLIKYDSKADISAIEYANTATVILGEKCFYALKDNSTIEKIDLDLNTSSFYSTSEYDMTTITYEGSTVAFYGYEYSSASAIKGVINSDGTVDVTTEGLILPETIEKMIPIGTFQ